MLLRFARVWAGGVYAAIVPVVPHTPGGAAMFLEDLWRSAPWRIALASTVGVLLIAISPAVVVGRFTLFHRLPVDDQERVLQRLMNARLYLVRLLFVAVKGQALVAVLRDEECRKALGLETA